MFSKIIFTAIASLILLPSVAFAAKIPVFNPVCWKKDACQSQRLQINPEAGKNEGWVKDPIECPGDDWGKCLPANVATTQIAFGGQQRFENIGVFIFSIYKYAIGVAGILAVVMIVIAGAQWVSSGGNSETINSAKKRIVGSLIGLFIAYSSYFILNTINPALVNLRLPQVYMIRPQHMVPRFCSQAPDTIKTKPNAFALAAGTDNQFGDVTPDSKTKFDLSFVDKDKKGFWCGKRFFMADGGSTTCRGDYCDPGNVCIDFGNNDPKNPFHCENGMLAGNIGGNVGGSMFGEPVIENHWYSASDSIRLIVMCKNGSMKEVKSTKPKETKPPQHYIIPKDDFTNQCGGVDNIAGFFLGVSANDNTGLTGQYQEGAPGSSGKSDWFAVGQSAPGSRVCNTNLAMVGWGTGGVTPKCTGFACTCSFLGSKTGDLGSYGAEMKAIFEGTVATYLVKNENFVRHLISVQDLASGGYICDLALDRGAFPAASNECDVLNSNCTVDLSACLIPDIK